MTQASTEVGVKNGRTFIKRFLVFKGLMNSGATSPDLVQICPSEPAVITFIYHRATYTWCVMLFRLPPYAGFQK